MCALSLTDGKTTKLHVTDGWTTPISRSLYYDSNDNLAVCLKQWLLGGESHTFLDKLRYDARIEEFMMIDRALTLPLAAVSKLKGNTVLSAASLNDNAAWSTKILNRHKLTVTKNWRSAVRHTLLIVNQILWALEELLNTAYLEFTMTSQCLFDPMLRNGLIL